MPEQFRGCFRGRPAGFDHVYQFSQGTQIGEPGEITFCYSHYNVEVPNAEVYIPPEKRAQDVAMLLGIAHTTFAAHGVKSEVYSVAGNIARGRTTLDIDPTLHLFHVIPIQVSAQPSKVDWKATVIDANTVHVEAYQVVWAFGTAAFGATWHADFTRINDTPGR